MTFTAPWSVLFDAVRGDSSDIVGLHKTNHHPRVGRSGKPVTDEATMAAAELPAEAVARLEASWRHYKKIHETIRRGPKGGFWVV